MTIIAGSRIAEEVRQADLGDKRRSKRLAQIVAKLEAAPALSFPKAFTEAELEGAYRFFSNEAVLPDAVVAPHLAASAERVRAYPEAVLAIHDTTTLSFPGGCLREGLTPTRGKNSAPGFLAHISLAVASGEVRFPLGALAISRWTRPPARSKKAGDVRESARWWDHVTAVETSVGIARQVIHVMDRESDDYALFGQMAQHGYRFVIRLSHDRVVTGEDGNRDKLFHQREQTPCVVTREVRLSSRKQSPRFAQQRIHPAREMRRAKLAMGGISVEIRHPKLQAKKRRGPSLSVALPETVTLNMVHVWEIDPPSSEQAISWTLLTNEPIATAADLERIVDMYRSRWVIEDYFKALKTGCTFLSRQLESRHALENCLATFIPIAYQLLRLRAEARQSNPSPAATVLHPTQLDVLREFARRPLPEHPTARDAYLAIAGLGGHLRRNGEPGWLTLLHGYQELCTLCRAWTAALRTRKCDQ